MNVREQKINTLKSEIIRLQNEIENLQNESLSLEETLSIHMGNHPLAIEKIVSIVQEFLPSSMDTKKHTNPEFAHGFNHCLRSIKESLR